MEKPTYIRHYASPLGDLTLCSDGKALTGLWFDGQKYYGGAVGADGTGDAAGKSTKTASMPVFSETARWLDLYFSGEIPDFTPHLHPEGSAFRKAVWDILLSIPYGQTTTYGEIAQTIARQRGLARMSAQAVGGAVGHNPIGIIIPCHRVIGTDGSLTGYAGGLDKKVWLLSHESRAKK